MTRRHTEIPLLPYRDWPAADRAAWVRALRPGALLSDGGSGAHWSERSRITIAWGYGKWLGYLMQQEHLTAECPAERVTSDTVRAYRSLLSVALSPVTVWNYIKQLYDAMRVMAPDRNWKWLRQINAELARAAEITGDKCYRVMDSGVLFELGLSLMVRAGTEEATPGIDQAITYRDGLIIALLAARPLRRRNLTALTMGRHISRANDIYLLHLDAGETKQHRSYECVLPTSLTPYIDRYLTIYRPRFPGADQHDLL